MTWPWTNSWLDTMTYWALNTQVQYVNFPVVSYFTTLHTLLFCLCNVYLVSFEQKRKFSWCFIFNKKQCWYSVCLRNCYVVYQSSMCQRSPLKWGKVNIWMTMRFLLHSDSFTTGRILECRMALCTTIIPSLGQALCVFRDNPCDFITNFLANLGL